MARYRTNDPSEMRMPDETYTRVARQRGRSRGERTVKMTIKRCVLCEKHDNTFPVSMHACADCSLKARAYSAENKVLLMSCITTNPCSYCGRGIALYKANVNICVRCVGVLAKRAKVSHANPNNIRFARK